MWSNYCIGEKTKVHMATHIALKSLGIDNKIRNRTRHYTIPFT